MLKRFQKLTMRQKVGDQRIASLVFKLKKKQKIFYFLIVGGGRLSRVDLRRNVQRRSDLTGHVAVAVERLIQCLVQRQRRFEQRQRRSHLQRQRRDSDFVIK